MGVEGLQERWGRRAREGGLGMGGERRVYALTYIPLVLAVEEEGAEVAGDEDEDDDSWVIAFSAMIWTTQNREQR